MDFSTSFRMFTQYVHSCSLLSVQECIWKWASSPFWMLDVLSFGTMLLLTSGYYGLLSSTIPQICPQIFPVVPIFFQIFPGFSSYFPDFSRFSSYFLLKIPGLWTCRSIQRFSRQLRDLCRQVLRGICRHGIVRRAKGGTSATAKGRWWETKCGMRINKIK